MRALAERLPQHEDKLMTIAERLIQKGALEVAREIACRLRDMGWTPERIQEATGLSGEELKKLFPDEQ
ncbi:putative transposase [Shigella sonnei]|nr:putative transposase [Shigella sonnei]